MGGSEAYRKMENPPKMKPMVRPTPAIPSQRPSLPDP